MQDAAKSSVKKMKMNSGKSKLKFHYHAITAAHLLQHHPTQDREAFLHVALGARPEIQKELLLVSSALRGF